MLNSHVSPAVVHVHLSLPRLTSFDDLFDLSIDLQTSEVKRIRGEEMEEVGLVFAGDTI